MHRDNYLDIGGNWVEIISDEIEKYKRPDYD